MNVIGHGLDLVDLDRFARLVSERGERFVGRCFTADEQAYAAACGARRVEALAARFAAKEAVLKALGTGFAEGVAWTEIEIERDPAGKPGIRLHGRVRELAEAAGVTVWHVSLTHAGAYAMASVLALGAVR